MPSTASSPASDPSVRPCIGFVSTQPDVPEFLTVGEAWQLSASIHRAPDWAGDEVRRALALPRALRVGHASSGGRRRIELLCALVGDPPILFLDEPFAHLDTQGAQWLVDAIGRWRASRVILLTGHGEPRVTFDQAVLLSQPGQRLTRMGGQ